MSHLVDRENTVVLGTVVAILGNMEPTDSKDRTRIKVLKSALAGTRHDSEDYDAQLTKLQAQLKHATAAKHSVDKKLANALKISERAYQSLVLADRRETELEEEIRRLKAWMQSSASSARDLDSAEI
ncbi:hypothetical protein FRC00_014680 [Tulasnella sp. 408]|nr:hypothetical protein FRC00_014680 [Tulasnella sp. 408]